MPLDRCPPDRCAPAPFTRTDVIFEDYDLSGVVAEDSSLCRVEFHRCRMSGIVLAGSVARDVLASDSRLDGANLRMLVGPVWSFSAATCVVRTCSAPRSPRAGSTKET